MSKERNVTFTLGINVDEVSLLCISGGDIKVFSKKCNSKNDWATEIKDVFQKSKITKKDKVRVVINSSLYIVAQIAKNEALTESEMYGLAMYKDLENFVQGHISDYTWDFYDTKTSKNSKPSLTFVLVEKQIIQLLSDIINSYAILDKITTIDLAMAEFISFYMHDSLKKNEQNVTRESGLYVNQLCVMLYLQNNKDLMVYAVHQGEICYSRALRGYKELSNGLVSGPDDPLISRLTTDILRLSDDFFTSQLGLPPMSKLLIVMDSDQLEQITDAMGANFRRIVEVIPLKQYPFQSVHQSFQKCENLTILSIADQGINYLPLFGTSLEGLFASEKN